MKKGSDIKYVPGERLTLKRALQLLLYSFIGFLMYFPGMYIGEIYMGNIISYLPEYLHGRYINFFFWAFVCVFVSLRAENIYLWRVVFSRIGGIKVSEYDIAPISIGIVVGFLTAWL